VDDSQFIQTPFMLKWLGVVGWFSIGVAIIFSIAWFFLPSSKPRRASTKRRPAEPDTTEADVGVFRWLSLLLMYFFWLMLVVFTMASASPTSNVRELNLEVALEDPAQSMATMPIITISAGGEVVFLELRLPPEDHELESLCVRLRGLAPLLNRNEAALIRPEPETTHQRIVEVLSALGRAGIRKPILL
jgi:biopolymer transport protein ExbD